MFRLDRRELFQKTVVLAEAREKYDVVCAQVTVFNTTIDEARKNLDNALAEYEAAVAKLKDFTERIASKHAEILSQSYRGWRRCGEVRDWISHYGAFRPSAPKIVFPVSVEAPNEDLLSYFEELPDSP